MIRPFAMACVLALAASAASAQPSPDTNKDGHISLAEHLAAGERGFKRMDANANGTIDPEEQAKIMKYTGGKNILAPADLNKDGRVSKEEFVKASNYRFKQADADSDGRLNKAEQQALMKARGV
ncbi:MAG TPA: EF-hand domain-containing protein [Caulobacter sp.]|nr:EF-hand domain-containing protein [Caulobacter sp.]